MKKLLLGGIALALVGCAGHAEYLQQGDRSGTLQLHGIHSKAMEDAQAKAAAACGGPNTYRLNTNDVGRGQNKQVIATYECKDSAPSSAPQQATAPAP